MRGRRSVDVTLAGAKIALHGIDSAINPNEGAQARSVLFVLYLDEASVTQPPILGQTPLLSSHASDCEKLG